MQSAKCKISGRFAPYYIRFKFDSKGQQYLDVCTCPAPHNHTCLSPRERWICRRQRRRGRIKCRMQSAKCKISGRFAPYYIRFKFDSKGQRYTATCTCLVPKTIYNHLIINRLLRLGVELKSYKSVKSAQKNSTKVLPFT